VEILRSIFKFVTPALWIAIPILLIFGFLDVWLFYKRAKYRNSLKFKLLEFKIPKDVIKGPKAMESIFAAVHNIWSFGINFSEKWLQGKVEPVTSFEIVGRGHGVHFFIRVQENFRNLIESAIYAQYPDAEISEVPDYVQDFPPVLPDKNYDVWGSDIVLAKDDAYPVLTYPHFEDRPSRFEESKIDPLAQLMEIMSNLNETEAVWLQILLRRIGNSWKEKGEGLISELRGEKKKSTGGFPGASLFEGLGEFLANLLAAPIQHPTWAEPTKKEEKKSEGGGGRQKIIEAIENKISKLGFESVVRFVYVDKTNAFSRGNVLAVVGSFWQFSSQTLNAFKLNNKTTTFGKGLFKKYMNRKRKRLLYDNYRIRHFPKKISILNTEELATIYHPPLTGVKAGRLRRTEFKRGGPPVGLPIES